jgi:hypothetical protein
MRVYVYSSAVVHIRSYVSMSVGMLHTHTALRTRSYVSNLLYVCPHTARRYCRLHAASGVPREQPLLFTTALRATPKPVLRFTTAGFTPPKEYRASDHTALYYCCTCCTEARTTFFFLPFCRLHAAKGVPRDRPPGGQDQMLRIRHPRPGRMRVLLRVCVGVCVFRAHVQVGRRRYVSIRQHPSAYVSIRQHTSAYVSIRQHTSAYVSIR